MQAAGCKKFGTVIPVTEIYKGLEGNISRSSDIVTTLDTFLNSVFVMCNLSETSLPTSLLSIS